jgi:hypothetical protein
MPALLLSTVTLDLKPAKTHGLGELGVPVVESTLVKKGKLVEYLQECDDGKVGRRFQNLRVTAVKTPQGGEVSSKLIVVFEVFGDDNVPVGANLGVAAVLGAGDETLAELPLGPLFLPYGCCWYENRYAVDIDNAVFDRCDRITFVTLVDQVRAI